MIIGIIMLCILGIASFLSGLFMFIESFQYHMTWNTTLLERLTYRTLFVTLMSLGIMLLVAVFCVR